MPRWTLESRRAASRRMRGNKNSIGKNLGNTHAAGRSRAQSSEERAKRSRSMLGNKNAIGHGRPRGTPQPLEWRLMMSKRFSGIGNPAYVDGLGRARAGKRNQDRRNLSYRLWRKAVFDRDKYACVMCGSKGCELHADHIIPYSVASNKRLSVENGRTLCAPCHRATPTYARRA